MEVGFKIISDIDAHNSDPDAKRTELVNTLNQIISDGSGASLLDFTTEICTTSFDWLDLDLKLNLIEFAIKNCKDDAFLFQILAVVKDYINQLLSETHLPLALYSKLYHILIFMAKLFAEKKIYQTAIDLYKSMISIGKTFQIDPALQLWGIYDAVELFEILEETSEVFELSVIGRSIAKNNANMSWEIAYERILEFSGYRLAHAYLNGAEALSWQSNYMASKNFIVNAIRAMSIIIQSKKRITPEMHHILDKIISLFSRNQNITREDMEIVEVLELLKTNKLSKAQILDCANTFLKYCDLTFRPTVDVILVILDGTLIFSQSSKKIQEGISTTIFSQSGQMMLSALVSAVSSSMKETLKTSEEMKQIQHGSQTVLIENENGLSLLLIADRETNELRTEMQMFMADVISNGFFEKFKGRLPSQEEYKSFFKPFLIDHFQKYFIVDMAN